MPDGVFFVIEEIGKESRNGVFAPVYVSSFFVVDPYRVHFPPKGWLIHEERLDISLSKLCLFEQIAFVTAQTFGDLVQRLQSGILGGTLQAGQSSPADT
ncbi:hypothetical protein OQE62_03000 [Microbulbifer halophilus]|nr:hypothetical protein [Microbulbifer halophilus]MCW8125533.1 hypothetical protein [Microbulbifer halophilus]